jgi:hypothetical protein
MDPSCFTADEMCDRQGDALNGAGMGYRSGCAYPLSLLPGKAVAGDSRLSRQALKPALVNGLMDSDTEVIAIDLVSTAEMDLPAFHLDRQHHFEVFRLPFPLPFFRCRALAQNPRRGWP